MNHTTPIATTKTQKLRLTHLTASTQASKLTANVT